MSHSRKRNRHALISFAKMNEIKEAVSSLVLEEEKNFSAEDRRLWALIQKILKSTNLITSDDLPTDQEKNGELVFYVQKVVDYILGLPGLEKFALKDFNPKSASTLEKISKVASFVQKHQAGNCQEKVFLGFHLLLLEMIAEGLADFQKTPSLKLTSFDNHFIFLVDERFLVDPWLNFAFPLPQGLDTVYEIFQPQDFGLLENYFLIDQNWKSYTFPNNVKKSNLDLLDFTIEEDKQAPQPQPDPASDQYALVLFNSALEQAKEQKSEEKEDEKENENPVSIDLNSEKMRAPLAQVGDFFRQDKKRTGEKRTVEEPNPKRSYLIN